MKVRKLENSSNMQSSSRNGRGRDNFPSTNGGLPGFPGFPGFPDPFASFGGLGGIGGGLPGFPTFPDPFAGFGGFGGFDNDPFFSNPFFSRGLGFRAPVGAGSSIGPSEFLNLRNFGRSGLNQGEGTFLDDRPYRPHNRQSGSRRGGVQIEELPDDHVGDDAGHSNSSQEPIVEHPEDEEGRWEGVHSQVRSAPLVTSVSRSRRQPEPSNRPMGTYSFQSSSVVFGGDEQNFYSSQTTRRQGADGVIEEEHQEKDTTTGRENNRLSRGLNDRGRSFTRKRNADGREERMEILHNLEQEEVQDFERQWETSAEKCLPNWKRSSSQRLGSGSEALPALTSGEGLDPSYGSRSNGLRYNN